jgi:hypothetical protein
MRHHSSLADKAMQKQCEISADSGTKLAAGQRALQGVAEKGGVSGGFGSLRSAGEIFRLRMV